MRLSRVRVRNYRSIRDTGWFEIEGRKTILVGANEAGKTALLQAIQQLNPPPEAPKFDALRDYPRAELSKISLDKRTDARPIPSDIIVVEGEFNLDDADRAVVEAIDAAFRDCTYKVSRKLDNKFTHELIGGPAQLTWGDISSDFARLSAHLEKAAKVADESAEVTVVPEEIRSLTATFQQNTVIQNDAVGTLVGWLSRIEASIPEDETKEVERHRTLRTRLEAVGNRDKVLSALRAHLPLIIYFSNYFKVRPRIHLAHLAERIDKGLLDDDQYDRGNQSLLKLLGFSAKELSDLGNAPDPDENDPDSERRYQDQLDKRQYQLNAASVQLTEAIRRIWNPDEQKQEASKLRVVADQQYLKVVVEDDLGVEIELDQRSEGFQWLVSFFVVFFAEARDTHKNAILLLDEPGVSLHGLKQREFRMTLTRLAEENQTVYTTHSPFLVGPDELDLVRVIEMRDRRSGTVVHTAVTAEDPAALLPLQEALGYDLAQSLFMQQQNLVVEGLTDLWYLEATADLLREAALTDLNQKIALLPAQSAGKVTYFATILHSNNLKVAALLDSDAAGESAAKQETLVHTLGSKRLLRTKDAYTGPVVAPEIEDLLRVTLLKVAQTEFGVDATAQAAQQTSRPIADLLGAAIPQFSKYRLAKAYVRWTRDHAATDLDPEERKQWQDLLDKINRALK